MRFLEEIATELDEIRLADLKELYQVDAAARMRVSRQIFGNIIAQTHKKVATALLWGKALRIVSAVDSAECVVALEGGRQDGARTRAEAPLYERTPDLRWTSSGGVC